MPPTTYKVTEARAHFSELLARARAGEEIVITKGHEPYARLLPPAGRGERESVPLGHLHLPDDLFDGDDPEQAAIDPGDRRPGNIDLAGRNRRETGSEHRCGHDARCR